MGSYFRWRLPIFLSVHFPHRLKELSILIFFRRAVPHDF